MNDKLLIIGAGVDRTKGIDFPLANTLMAEIATFAKTDGKDLDDMLRSILPNLRFTFATLISRSIERITTREVHEQRALIERLNNVLNTLSGSDSDGKMRKHGMLLVKLFDKLATVAENAALDDEITNLIKDVFGEQAEEYLEDDSIIDISKMSLSETFKQVLKQTLRLSLNKEHHKIASVLGADMLNIENLLVEKFLGFYNNKPAEIKNYIYISWMMWAYLVYLEKEVYAKYSDSSIPFYCNVPKEYKAITLNYTSFIEKILGQQNVLYFHGGLNEYVRMDRRELNDIDDFDNIDIKTFFNTEIRSNTKISDIPSERQKHIIPALVPPLRIKPILSSRYIEIWHQASEWIKEASKIIIIGYSFNSADDHFNDILRQNQNGKTIYIVAPDIHNDNYLQSFSQIFGVSPKEWTETHKFGFSAKKYNDVYLLAAYADQIDFSKI